MAGTGWRPAQVDYAQGVAVRVAEHHEVRVRRIHIPVEFACPESDEPVDLGFLFGSGVHEQVKVDTRIRLDRRRAALLAQRPAGPVCVVQRSPVVALPFLGGHKVERCGPKGNGAGHIDHTDRGEPESEHEPEPTTPRARTPAGTGRRKRFSSAILPPWWRKSPTVAEVLPLRYLHGPSTGDFGPALEQFLGSAAGLPTPTISQLTTQWQDEHRAFARRDLAGSDYVYLWADGIHLRIRLEQARSCVLVLIGVRGGGAKELVALAEGYRESPASRADLLRDRQIRSNRPSPPCGSGPRSPRAPAVRQPHWRWCASWSSPHRPGAAA